MKMLYQSLRLRSLLNFVTNAIFKSQWQPFNDSPRETVLQAIVNSMAQVLSVDLGILRLFDEEKRGEELYLYQNPNNKTANLSHISREILALTAWKTLYPEAIDDVTKAPQDNSWQTQQRSLAFSIAKIRSTLIVPIIFEFNLIGVLALHQFGQPRRWQKEEIQLTLSILSQAALAISQASAYEQVRALAQRESTINTITAAIRSTLEPEKIFAAITKQLGQALNVDGCTLSLWTKTDRFVQLVGLYNPHESPDKNEEKLSKRLPRSIVPISENPVLQKLLQTAKPVVLQDLESDRQMASYELPLHRAARALLIVPLIVDGEILGSITLRQNDRSRRWSKSDLELAEAVASQAAIAVQQAKLYKTTKQQAELLRESEQRVKQLNNYLTESVLKRFLPAAIVNKAATGELELDLSPEPRLVTILFSDLVGFTPLSSKLGTSRIAQLLNEYLEAMTKAVFEHGGTVDKFIGDGVMALFGAPEELSPQEQVKRAIATAKTMHLHLAKLNQSWQDQEILGINGCPQLQFRCGIHQGSAVVGMFGGGQRSDYTAIGPAVNIASRLQEAATPNSILISDTVASYLENLEVLKIQSLKLKGMEENFLAFSLVW